MRPLKSVVFGLLVLLSMSSAAADVAVASLNLKNADIRAFVDQIAVQFPEKTFVLDPRLKGNVTVVSKAPLSRAALYEVFQTVLRQQGYVVSENKGVVEVVTANEIKQTGAPVDDRSNGEIMITRLFQMENLSAMELVPILRPLVVKYGHLAGVPSANAIIISDHAYNVERIADLIEALDSPAASAEQIEVVTLEYAWVTNMVTLLQNLVPGEVATANEQGRTGSTASLRIVADERSNRLILNGEPAAIQRIKVLIQQLDTPSIENDSAKVIFLDNADAKKLASMLKDLVAGSGKTQAQGQPPVQPAAIIADEDLNALVVRAEPSDLVEIESLVRALDVPRAQVLIEAAIVEVSGSLGEQFGIQMVGGPGTNNGVPVAATNFSEAGTSVSGLIGAAVSGVAQGDVGVATGVLGELGNGLFAGFGLSGSGSFGAIVQALESQSNTNLLSTPSLMTLDNNEASLIVGETVPFRTTSGGSDGGNPYETISREDVATELTVIPHIQNNDMIRLEVDQTTEELIGDNTGGTLTSRTSKRQITTEILVKDTETIILGGLVKDRVIESVSKVPFLGDLPFVGPLFRSTSTSREKVNLMIILRPTIIREKTTEQAQDRYNGIFSLQLEWQEGMVVPDVESLFEGHLM